MTGSGQEGGGGGAGAGGGGGGRAGSCKVDTLLAVLVTHWGTAGGKTGGAHSTHVLRLRLLPLRSSARE